MRLSVAQALLLLGLIVTTGMVAAVGIQTLALGELRIDGPRHRAMVADMDLIADVMPPPLYVLEAYTLAQEAVLNPERSADIAARLETLRARYEERKALWSAAVLDPEVRTALDASLARGDAVWAIVEKSFLPTLKKGSAASLKVSVTKLKVALHQQGTEVETLIGLVDGKREALREESNRLAGVLSLVSLGAGAASVLVFVLGLALFRQRAIQPLSRVTAYVRTLAAGDLSGPVPYLERSDEIGAIAAAVEVFRANAIGKQQAEAEAGAARALAERQRAEAGAQEAERAAEKAALARQQTAAVSALSAALARVAEGDLSVQIETRFSGDLDTLRQAFNQAIGRFAAIVAQLRLTSAQLKSATGEILAGANDLADRTTRQAATIEQTAAAMTELHLTVNENARAAERASERAQRISETAGATGAAMSRSNEAMARISAASSRISSTIGLIDDVAFQTNLLALNASVEAARAGDAGKGFAVVAIEVRRLAQSAARAAKEVRALIEQSAGEVQSGGKLVTEATQKLTAMLAGVNEAAALMRDISAASHGQSAAIGEVLAAIQEMDEMTQHNAALVEQTNAAIEQTESRAVDLDRIVEQFRVEREDRAAA